MKEFQQKQKTRRRLYSLPVLAVLSILTIFMIRGVVEVVQIRQTSVIDVNRLQEKVSILSDRERELEGGIERLKTEAGINEEIKEKFNVTQSDEQVAIIVDAKKATSTEDISLDVWYKKVWHKIINLW